MEQQNLGKKILLIEDDPNIADMYLQKFQLEGFEPLHAPNGSDGLQMALNSHPQLILCDIMMPIKDGISFLQDIKSDPATAEIPVIMLTNVPTGEYQQKCIELGALKYLIKSKYTPSEIVEEVRQALRLPSSDSRNSGSGDSENKFNEV